MRTHHIARVKKQQAVSRPLHGLILTIAIAEPLMTIPQIYQIWSTHSAAGVSVLTWGFYVLSASVWLAYGLRIKDRPLIVSSTLWIITEVAVLVGALVYS